jgi:hypothetical protein
MIEAEFQDRRANHEQQLTPEEFEQALEELAEYSDKMAAFQSRLFLAERFTEITTDRLRIFAMSPKDSRAFACIRGKEFLFPITRSPDRRITRCVGDVINDE